MQIRRQMVEVEETGRTARRFVFVLLDNFSLLSFAGALDALRIANRMAGRDLYSWLVIGEAEDEVTCSAGPTFRLDDGLIELNRDDIVMICGGIDV